MPGTVAGSEAIEGINMKILPDTFKPSTATPSEVGNFYAERINGTVEVEFNNKTVTAYASKEQDGSIYAYGFLGRYRTGTKLWHCTVWTMNGNTVCWFGFDQRSMNRRFHKSDIFFVPDRFFNVEAAA